MRIANKHAPNLILTQVQLCVRDRRGAVPLDQAGAAAALQDGLLGRLRRRDVQLEQGRPAAPVLGAQAIVAEIEARGQNGDLVDVGAAVNLRSRAGVNECTGARERGAGLLYQT